jgi:DNA-binding NarL/FixJ family response regulator/signal transduction histidine kinase
VVSNLLCASSFPAERGSVTRGRERLTAALITVGIIVLGATEAALRARSMYHPPSIIDLASSQRSGSPGDSRGIVIVLGLMLVIAGIASACGLARARPGWALVALWITIGAHVVLAAGMMFTEVAAAFAAFGIGRWGDRRLLRLVGLSIPIAVITSIWLINPMTWLAVLPVELEQAVWNTQLLLWVLPPLVIGVLIGIPWLTGILRRTRSVAQKSEHALHEAELDLARIDEIARLQGEKARVARDVHDVVGHSLTVILAQAESARYLVSSPEQVENSLSNIADTARRSLHQVRDVLASTTESQGIGSAPPGELDELVAGVRTSGTQVEIVDAQADMIVVGQAENGAEAVQLVDQLAPDVVLMDLRMPILDGATATREILSPARVAARARPVRIIVLTTFDLDANAAAAIRYGASGFLLKDATPASLGDAIRTVHSGNAVLAPLKLTSLIESAFRARREPPESFSLISERERSVFDAVARGLSNAEVARELYISEPTVKTHVGSLLRKLELRDRVQLVVYAHENGLLLRRKAQRS